MKVQMTCTCKYCGNEFTFVAKSKADAARMTGPAVCTRTACLEKQDAEVLEEVKRDTCAHPPARVFTWFVGDTLCASCCDCGTILAGGVE